MPRYDLLYYMLDESGENNNRQLVSRLKYLDTPVGFRTAFMYGNIQYILAAHLHEELTGEKWETSVDEQILKPLGMEDTHFDLSGYKSDPGRSVSYQDSMKVEIDHIAPMYSVSGMGNMFSSVRDLQKWGNFLVNGNEDVLSDEYLDFNQMGHFSVGYEEPYPGFSALQYGLGWFVFDYYGHKVVMHHGDNIGHQSLVFLLPDEKISGVILANNSFGNRSFPFTMLFSILDMASGKDLNNWLESIPAGRGFVRKYPDSLKVEQELSKKELEEYVGKYEHEGFGKIKVYLNDAETLMAEVGHFETMLEPYQEDRFRSTARIFDEDYIFEFERTGNRVTALRTDVLERTLPLIRFKKSLSDDDSAGK